MSSPPAFPDYDLEDLRIIESPEELKAVFHPLRDTILDLLLERAATVTELAEALRRPKSTVAYHVGVLERAGILKVVRTRRVRAIDERFYGRTARTFYVGRPSHPAYEPEQDVTNYLADAAREAEPAHRADDMRAILRHARIPHESAKQFWDRVLELVSEFSSLPRGGDTVYGFVAGLYPSDYPSLPEAQEGGSDTA